MSNPKICQPAVPATFFKSGWPNRHTCRQVRQHGEFGHISSRKAATPLGTSQINTIAFAINTKAKIAPKSAISAVRRRPGSVAFADLTIQIPANGRRGRILRPWRSQYHPNPDLGRGWVPELLAMAGQKTETTDVISGAIGVDVQRARALRTRCETLACWRYKRNPTNFY
jgi:hypothetical protein